MRPTRLRPRAAVLPAVLLLAACATGRPAGTAPQAAVQAPRAAAQAAPGTATTAPAYLGEPYAPPPPIRTGPDGVFRAALVAESASIVVADTPRLALTFNKTMNPPVLRMNPGDSISMVVTNRLPPALEAWTNYHYHGFNVSPMPPADNVTFIQILPQASFKYGFRLPKNIPQGLHWYHPHPHGISQMQLQRGMSGVISVGDVLKEAGYPSDLTERFMLIRDYSFQVANNPKPFAACWGPNFPYMLMNGQHLTRLDMRPGETQFWRIANVGSDRVYNLKLRGLKSGPLRFHVIAQDGNLASIEYDADSLVISPGNRFEVLVRAPASADTLEFYTPEVLRDTGGCTYPPTTFAWAVVSGEEAGNAPHRAVAFETAGSAVQADTMRMVAAAERVREFTVRFARDTTGGNTVYVINGKPYSTTEADSIKIGEVQEWTVLNEDFLQDLHAFHIHQGDFQVVAVMDTLTRQWIPHFPNGRIDTVMIPRQGGVKIRFVYTDPALAGMFVYHCHMLFHEDNAMMRNLCLYDPNSSNPNQCTNPFGTSGHAAHTMN